jgi:hypothetical protein
MAFPWLTALEAIPWIALLKHAPALVEAADGVLDRAKRRDALSRSGSELQAIGERLAELDARDRANAALAQQLAGELEALAAAIEAIAARVRLALALAIAAAAAALLAWIVVLAR